jgi:hypothetical protein
VLQLTSDVLRNMTHHGCRLACSVRESVDITRLSTIVRGHMAGATAPGTTPGGGDAGGASGELGLSTYSAAQAATGGDVQLQDADAELVFHDRPTRGACFILSLVYFSSNSVVVKAVAVRRQGHSSVHCALALEQHVWQAVKGELAAVTGRHWK